MFQIYVCVQNISVDVTNYGYICKDFIWRLFMKVGKIYSSVACNFRYSNGVFDTDILHIRVTIQIFNKEAFLEKPYRS